jgi:hypothetical protein
VRLLAITHFIFAVVQQDIRRSALRSVWLRAAHDSDEEFEFGLQALLDRAEALAGKRTDA